MDKKKIIMIVLGAISLLFFLVILHTLGAKQSVERERDNLKKENSALGQKIDGALQENSRLQNKLNSINKELEKISQQRDELQKRYDLSNKEKEGLMDQLEELKKQKSAAPQQQQQQQVQQTTPAVDDAYWAGILKAKTDLEVQLQGIRDELRNLQIANEQLKREKSNFELDISGLARQNDEFKKQYDYNQKIMDSLTQELVREKNDKFRIQSSLKTLKSENIILRRQLKSLTNRKASLEKKLAELQHKNIELDSNLSRTQTYVKEKISQIDALQERLDVVPPSGPITKEERGSVELPPIVVRPEKETSAITSSLTGKTILVNRDNNFVIIDLGEEAGVKLGDTFEVYRNGNSIASIEVIQARKNIAACDIKRETTPIKPGDTVK